MIKKITYWMSIISFTLLCNVSTASFIDLSSLHIIDISTIDTSTIDTSTSKISTTETPRQQNLQANIHQKVQGNRQEADQRSKGTAFNQELQWRILNLLTQQLFDNNHESISDMLFSNSWLYDTNTFSVSISSNDPDFYQVSIIDSQQGDKTQLEIPRL